MTAPTSVDCRCGHPREAHQAEHDGMCVLAGCQCLTYRPKVAPAVAAAQLPPRPNVSPAPRQPEPPISVQGERGPTLEQILQAGKRSEFGRTVKLTEKIALLVHDLRGRLADERHAVEERRKRDAEAQTARVEVERLSRELAAARARLKGNAPDRGGLVGDGSKRRGAYRPTYGEFPCPNGCGKVATTAQGRSAHARHCKAA